jgi:hypothetical protein
MKSYLVKIPFVFLLVGFAFSCQKNNDKPDPIEVNVVEIPSKIDGYCDNLSKFELKDGSLKLTLAYTSAQFYSHLVDRDSAQYFNLSNTVDVGTVTVNDNVAYKQTYSLTSSYTSSSFSVSLQRPIKWHITGAGSFKEMSFYDDTPVPTFVYPQHWPDTIYGYKDNIVGIGSHSGTEKVDFGLQWSNGKDLNAKWLRSLSNQADKVTLSTSDLQLIDNGDKVRVEIRLFVTAYKTIENKILSFTTAIDYLSPEIPFKAKP